MTADRFAVRFSDTMPTCKYQQSRRRPSGPYATNVAKSQNPGKAVVVVAAVLGPETAEMLGTSGSITRGTKASRSAKHGLSPRELAADSQSRLNN